jgi:hypothetical protein
MRFCTGSGSRRIPYSKGMVSALFHSNIHNRMMAKKRIGSSSGPRLAVPLRAGREHVSMLGVEGRYNAKGEGLNPPRFPA